MLGRLFRALQPSTLAEISVPGEATVSLPSGKVKVLWEEEQQGRSLNIDEPNYWDGAPPELQVEVRPAAGGDPLEVESGLLKSEGARGGRIYRQVGTVRVPSEGEYVVRVGLSGMPDYMAEPRVILAG